LSDSDYYKSVTFAASSADRVERELANVDTRTSVPTTTDVKPRLVQRKKSKDSGNVITLRIVTSGILYTGICMHCSIIVLHGAHKFDIGMLCHIF